MRTLIRYVLWGVAFLVVIASIVVFSGTPSNDRAWAPDQAILPYAEFVDNMVTIRNIRDIHYRTEDDFDVRHYDATFDLDTISSVDFIYVPFGDWTGPAHTFLTFGFDNGEYVAVSVEIRKQVGDTFSAFKGLFRRYEIMYVIASEQDLIGLRAIHRNDDVYLYPIDAPREKIREVFVDMLARANDLHQMPEFYNTLTNTCTTNIVRHVNSIADRTRIPFTYKVILPAYSDQLAYDLGLIKTNVSFEATRAQAHISERVREYIDKEDFSERIRN